MMTKKVIIAGGRRFNDYDRMANVLDALFDPITDYIIVSGDADGADLLGQRYAEEEGLEVEHHPADWHKYGRGAGFKRNLEMALSADMLCAFWDGKSKGTRGMILDALHEGLEVHVYRYTDNEDTTEEEDV